MAVYFTRRKSCFKTQFTDSSNLHIQASAHGKLKHVFFTHVFVTFIAIATLFGA